MHYSLEASKLQHLDLTSLEDHRTLYDKISHLLPRDSGRAQPLKISSKVWDAAASSADAHRVILTGSLQYQSSQSKSIFRLQLAPLNIDTKSTRFFRKFGAHRFLRLSIPSLKPAPPHIGRDARARLHASFQAWLNAHDKPLMGCMWSAFFVKPSKVTRKDLRFQRLGNDLPGHDVFFFATHGPDLKPFGIRELLDWLLPLESNHDMTYCKAFARIELGFSRTLPTIVFKPSQIREVHDQYADGAPEDERLNDLRFSWEGLHNAHDPRVMTDGCSRISYAAASRVWDSIGLPDALPSAFQGRIGPAKGVWMVERNLNNNNEDVWIEFTPSQTKWRRHFADYHEDTFDPQRLTFEVSDWSRRPTSSTLYLEYLLILEDRGVPRTALAQFVSHMLSSYSEQFRPAITDPRSLRQWLQENSRFVTDAEDVDASQWLSSRAFSKRRADKIKTLLEVCDNSYTFC